MKLYLVTCLLIGYLSNLDNVDSMFVVSMESFSVDLYKIISKNESKNVILSPYSANVALAMVLSGAEGNTRRQLKQTLHLKDDDFTTHSIENHYSSIHQVLTSGVTSELIILNKAFINNLLNVKEKYHNALTSYFNAEEELVNFANKQQAVRTVNSWVSRGTNGKINEILSADDVNSNTAMVLANVVYFKGEWQYKFEDFNHLYFKTASGQRSLVPGMLQLVNVLYGNVPQLGASFVELPYKGNNNFSMTIILPDNGVSLKEVERRLETMTVPDVRMNRSLRKVAITMPQFKFERSIDLIPALQEMGVRDLFIYNVANLTGISATPFSVDKIQQKVVIEVNKEGSEAAAATAVVGVFRSANARSHDEPISFVVDRPFHFKIMRTAGRNDGIVLFSGNYKGPEYN